jgi:hypothetical protein
MTEIEYIKILQQDNSYLAPGKDFINDSSFMKSILTDENAFKGSPQV